MSILIVAALKVELSRILAECRAEKTDRIGGFENFTGSWKEHPVRFGVLGIGVVSTALALGSFLSSEQPEAIVMVGSAGALPGSGLGVGDLVIAESEILSEIGALQAPGIGDPEPLRLPGLSQEIPFDAGLSAHLVSAAEQAGGAARGKLLTVVGVSARPEQAAARADRFQALAENMEGYGLALAGRHFNVKTAEIRGISNVAGDRDKTRWDFKTALDRSQSAALEFLRRVS
jgi:futalosine hydrolase